MKIVILDHPTENPGEICWSDFDKYGEVTRYPRTLPEQVVERISACCIRLFAYLQQNKSTKKLQGIRIQKKAYYFCYCLWCLYISYEFFKPEIIRIASEPVVFSAC